MGYYIVDIQVIFNEQTKKVGFTQLSDSTCQQLLNGDQEQLWIAVNNVSCNDMCALAEYVGKCFRRGMLHEQLILNMAKECYSSMPLLERKVLQKAVSYGVDCNNRTLLWNIEEATVGFLATKICDYIRNARAYVEEVEDICDMIQDFSLQIYNGYSRRKPRPTSALDYFEMYRKK